MLQAPFELPESPKSLPKLELNVVIADESCRLYYGDHLVRDVSIYHCSQRLNPFELQEILRFTPCNYPVSYLAIGRSMRKINFEDSENVLAELSRGLGDGELILASLSKVGKLTAYSKEKKQIIHGRTNNKTLSGFLENLIQDINYKGGRPPQTPKSIQDLIFIHFWPWVTEET